MRVRFSGRWCELADIQAVLNHPGHSSQKSHGRRGGPGTGEDLIAAGKAEQVAAAAYEAASRYRNEAGDVLAGRRLYHGAGVGPHGDEALHTIAEMQGFGGPARTASAKEMDKGVRRGDTEMFRGVRASHDGKLTASQVHERTATGEPHYGLGYSGNGIYASSSRGEAGRYGSVGRYALDREAKVVDYRDLQREQATFLRTVGQDSTTGRVFSDPGRYATARGYDAIRWRRGEETGKRAGEEDEFIVLNRTALIAETS